MELVVVELASRDTRRHHTDARRADRARTATREGRALATGDAGTVYLCHPFLVHAAQPHRGTLPRFMAQPPLLPRGPLPADAPVMRPTRA